MWQGYHPYAPAAFTPQELPLVLISVRGCPSPLQAPQITWLCDVFRIQFTVYINRISNCNVVL